MRALAGARSSSVSHDGEGVAHGVQQVNPVVDPQGVGPRQAFDGRTDRHCPGADDQLVVGQEFLVALAVGDEELAALDVDATGHRVEAKLHAGRFEVGDGPMRQVAPVGDLTRDVIGDPADGEVRVGVGHHHGDFGAGVELAGPQRGADAGVASSDGNDVHWSPLGRHVTALMTKIGVDCCCTGACAPSSRWWGTTMSDASAGVTPGIGALTTAKASAPPTISAATKAGTDDGAMPAKVLENMRPTVMAGLAKLVELVKK